MSSRFMDILRLYRIHTGAASASVPLIAGIILGAQPVSLLLIGIGAVAHHAWGFSLNEIIDLDVDSSSGVHTNKPLVSGRISKNSAHILSLLALMISFIMFTGAALLEGSSVLFPLSLLLAATISGTIYDLWGKRFPLSDIFVSGWMVFMVLAAGSTVEGSISMDTAVWAAAALGGLHILFNNSVEGGLKDAEGDRRSGARTLAVILGVRWKGDRASVTAPFILWGLFLRSLFVICAMVFTYLIAMSHAWGAWVVVTVGVWGSILFAHSMLFLRAGYKTSRKELIRTFSIHEVLSLGLSLLVVAPAAGVLPAVLVMVLPLVWFIVMNHLMYETSMVPKV
ncbi:MAG: UbiA family prenyltransferase [Candidatus Thermoplasmatota archaeon]|nr:UbiA family prenyltransferase [Candidatus Thermoplasmatota archaeon]